MSDHDPTTDPPPMLPNPDDSPPFLDDAGEPPLGFEPPTGSPADDPQEKRRWDYMKHQRRAATEGQMEAEALRAEVGSIQNLIAKYRTTDANGYFDVRRIGPANLPPEELGRIGKLPLGKLGGKATIDEEVDKRWGAGEYVLVAKRANHVPIPGGEVTLEIAGTPKMVSEEGREWFARTYGKNREDKKASDPVGEVGRIMELMEQSGMRRGGGGSDGGSTAMNAVLLQMQESRERHDKWMLAEAKKAEAEKAAREAREQEERDERISREARRRKEEEDERLKRQKADEEEREERKARREAEAARRQKQEDEEREERQAKRDKEAAEDKRRHERQLAEDKSRFDLMLAEIQANSTRQMELMRQQIEARRDERMLDPKRIREVISDLAVDKLRNAAGLPSEDAEPDGWGGTIRKLIEENGGQLIQMGVEAISKAKGRGAPAAAPAGPQLIQTAPQQLAGPPAAETEPQGETSDVDVDVGGAPAPDAAQNGNGQPQGAKQALIAHTAQAAALSVMNFTRVLATELLAQRAPVRAWTRPQNEQGISLVDLYEDMPAPGRDAFQKGWRAFAPLVPPPTHEERDVIDELISKHPNGASWMREFIESGPWVEDEDELDDDDDGDVPVGPVAPMDGGSPSLS